MDRVDQFVNDNINQFVEADGSPVGSKTRNQCVDLIKKYIKFLGLPAKSGDAWNWDKNADGVNYKWVANTLRGVPKKGDIVVFTNHISIFLDGNWLTFRSFDQNWPISSACHIQSHSYRGLTWKVKGWLHLPVLDKEQAAATQQNSNTSSPVVSTQRTYTIKSGDTLSSIAKSQYSLSRWADIQKKYLEIAALNGIAAPYVLKVGRTIKLP